MNLDGSRIRTEPLAAINSVALGIGRFANLDEMLDHALRKVLEVVQTDAGSVYLLDEARGDLVLAVSHGLSPEVQQDFDHLQIGEGLSGRVMQTGMPIVLRSLMDDPRLTRMAARSAGFRAFASVPLLSSFKTYGTLNVHSCDDREFTEEDIQLLTSMAAQIGLAVANTRLYLELDASERKFRGLVENAEDMIYLTDPAGRLTYINSVAERLLGVDPLQVCAERRPVLSLVHPDDLPRVGASFERMLAGEMLRSFDVRMVTTGGATVWMSQTNVPLRDETGVIVGMQGTAQDVTRRRELEQQMAQAERLADLGRMAAHIAHEIRNPLGAIVNSITVLRRPGTPPDPKLLQIVTEEADRLDRIIREFLLFARPPARASVPCHLTELIDDTILLFNRDGGLPAGITLRTACSATLPLVVVDPSQIRQVLWNLLRNAAEAMPRGGTIDVTAAPVSDAPAVTIAVTDDGPGVEDDANVFVPFYTTRPQGTGLGLAIVERIVRDHGGHVSVTNVSGRGACFRLQLPLTSSASRPLAGVVG